MSGFIHPSVAQIRDLASQMETRLRRLKKRVHIERDGFGEDVEELEDLLNLIRRHRDRAMREE